MMKHAIIVHGSCGKEEYFSDKYLSLSNSHWLPWLQKQLLIRGIFTQTPEMPEAYKPDYKKWKKEFKRFLPTDILVGYSAGGGFLVHYLSENKTPLGNLVLVAPWMDPNKIRTTDFFDFAIDPGIINRCRKVDILFSENEWVEGVRESVEKIKTVLPQANFHLFKKMGHFTKDDLKTEKFPELLEIIISK